MRACAPVAGVAMISVRRQPGEQVWTLTRMLKFSGPFLTISV